MIHYKPLILLLSFIALSSACSNKLSTSDYIAWVKDPRNGLRKQRTSSSAEYILQYEPALYKAINTSENKSLRRMRAMSEQFEDLHYFLLKVKTNKVSFRDDKAITQYLAYGMRNKIRFSEGADTVDQTVMYHLESSGGLTPYHRILVAFPKAMNSGNLQFIIDSGEFEQKKQVFAFDKSVLKRLETINKRIE